jgi:hypothetical protein
MRFYLRVQLNTVLQKTKPKKLQLILNSTIELCLQDEEIIKIIIQVIFFYFNIALKVFIICIGKWYFNTFSNSM